MKIKRIEFDDVGFRNLHDFSLDISPRITIIAGHNGIGKSTILGLIANGSELNTKNSDFSANEIKTLTDSYFKAEFSEIFFLHHDEDFTNREYGPSQAKLYYQVEDQEVIKECSVTIGHKTFVPKNFLKDFMKQATENDLTPRQKDALNKKNENIADPKKEYVTVFRPRIVPRILNTGIDEDFLKFHHIGKDAKMPIPTLYIGMSRISPIGEFDWTTINQKLQNTNSEAQDLIYKIFSSIITSSLDHDKQLYNHSFSRTNKKSLVPNFGHSSLTISLGQDSLSSIVTALVSFDQLKTNIKSGYKGGILVIDEIEAGLHPQAQVKLIDQLKKYAKLLQLQIIMTTHSLTIIKEILDNEHFDPSIDSVIYLIDTNSPHPMPNPTYLKIKNDMLLYRHKNDENIPVENPKICIYFEDIEAHDFLMGILESQNITDTFSKFGRELILIPAKLGSSNLLKLHNSSPHFQKSLTVLDADIENSGDKKQNDKLDLSKLPNVILLPLEKENELYDKLPPDQISYIFLLEKSINIRNNSEFWRYETEDWFSSDYYSIHIKPIESVQDYSIENIKRLNRKLFKNWYNKNRNDLLKLKVFKLWADEHPQECVEFITKLSEKISLISTLEVNL